MLDLSTLSIVQKDILIKSPTIDFQFNDNSITPEFEKECENLIDFITKDLSYGMKKIISDNKDDITDKKSNVCINVKVLQTYFNRWDSKLMMPNSFEIVPNTLKISELFSQLIYLFREIILYQWLKLSNTKYYTQSDILTKHGK